MTEREFNRRWGNAVTDLTNELFRDANRNIAQFGRPEILLEPAKAKLLTRIAWIIDESKTEETPKKIVIPPKQIKPRENAITAIEKRKVWNDGYDFMRSKNTHDFIWKKCR